MRSKRRLIKFSLGLGVLFVLVGLLVYPVWADLNAQLGSQIPILQILIVSGCIYCGYSVYWLKTLEGTREPAGRHLIFLGLVDAIFVVLLVLLVLELDWGVVLMFRTLTQNSLAIFGSLAVVLVIWFWPRWRPLSSRGKVIILSVLGLGALVWISLPWHVDFMVQPVVFMQQDGVTATWGTNMPAVHEIHYGSTPAMEHHSRPQYHGLRQVNDGLAAAYLPDQPAFQDLYIQVEVDGIRKVKRSSTASGGHAVSPIIQVEFPPVDDDLFLVSFSDTHEIYIMYRLLARHIPWDRVDYPLFLGDFVVDVSEPQDLVKNLLALSTGDRNRPRVFVRGNHEARGPGARELSNIFLPPGGSWYYTFTHGDTLFIVLDSGEDKSDDHIEYAGLVDFNRYHQEQAVWLAQVFDSPAYQDAQHRLVLVHAPPHITNYMSPAFLPVVDLLKTQTDIDLVLSGHTHKPAIWLPDETGWPYPIAVSGGPLGFDTAAVTVLLNENGVQINVVNIFGQVLETAQISAADSE